MTPTFGNLDFGLPGGSLNPNIARSTASVRVGDPQHASVEFAFVGVSGKFAHNLGARGRRVTWTLHLRTAGLSTLNSIVTSIENAKSEGAAQLTDSKGRTFSRARIVEVRELGRWEIIKSGSETGWYRQDYEVVFDVLSGD